MVRKPTSIPEETPDNAVPRARGTLGMALRWLDEDAAAAAARALVRAKKADQARKAQEALADLRTTVESL